VGGLAYVILIAKSVLHRCGDDRDKRTAGDVFPTAVAVVPVTICRRLHPPKIKKNATTKVVVAPLMDGKTMGQIADRVGVGNDTRRFI
jgi:hypothetical protein